MNATYVENNTEASFLEAYYDSGNGEVAIFGNPNGLSYLRGLIDDLIKNGIEGSHYHLEHFSGLDGNVNLILGRKMKSAERSDPKPPSKPSSEFLKDIPDEVISLINEDKFLEAIKIFKKNKNVSLAEAKEMVSGFTRVRQAGLVLTRENSKT